MVATFRYTDANAKEQWVYHAAGARGLGGSSYIDSVACRDRDANSGWASAADSTMEERVYYLQNWRADVVAISDTAGDILEWVKYSSYGVPICIPMGDYDTDGDVDAADVTFLDSAINGGTGWWRDFNRDGAENGSDTGDLDTYRTGYSGGTGGRGVLSRSGVANRIGYAGYQWDPAISADHVRHRVYRPEVGRWTRRDPLEYIDGNQMYAYTASLPVIETDPSGLVGLACTFYRYHYEFWGGEDCSLTYNIKTSMTKTGTCCAASEFDAWRDWLGRSRRESFCMIYRNAVPLPGTLPLCPPNQPNCRGDRVIQRFERTSVHTYTYASFGMCGPTPVACTYTWTFNVTTTIDIVGGTCQL